MSGLREWREKERFEEGRESNLDGTQIPLLPLKSHPHKLEDTGGDVGLFN